MNELSVKSAIRTIGAVGSGRKQAWLIQNGCTMEDLEEAVEMEYLIKCDKDPKDFMSDTKYIVTQKGREFAWEREWKV